MGLGRYRQKDDSYQGKTNHLPDGFIQLPKRLAQAGQTKQDKQHPELVPPNVAQIVHVLPPAVAGLVVREQVHEPEKHEGADAYSNQPENLRPMRLISAQPNRQAKATEKGCQDRV